MKELLVCEDGVLYQVVSRQERALFRDLMNRYNVYGYVGQAPMMFKRMDIVYCKKNDWCVLFTIHLVNNFNLAVKYKLPLKHTWFLRRVACIEKCKEKYGHVTLEAYRCLIQFLKKLKAKAIISLVVMGSGATYKYLDFKEIGKTVNGKGRWFVLWL